MCVRECVCRFPPPPDDMMDIFSNSMGWALLKRPRISREGGNTLQLLRWLPIIEPLWFQLSSLSNAIQSI
jgi:hypothetical protein